jgi:hypothetical protein
MSAATIPIIEILLRIEGLLEFASGFVWVPHLAAAGGTPNRRRPAWQTYRAPVIGSA